MTKLLLSLSCAAALVAAASASEAMPIASDTAGVSNAPIILAAQGCGYGWYRGPGGYCHRFGYGPYPGGYWGRVSRELERLPFGILAWALGPLPQHAVPWPTARWRLEIAERSRAISFLKIVSE